MSIRGIVELAALIASQGNQIIESPQPISQTALREIWVASRKWLLHLMRELDEFTVTAADPSSPTKRAENWPRLKTALEQVFATGMLIRVLGAVLVARDDSPNTECEKDDPIAHNMLILQLQARQRALLALVDGLARSHGDIARVDRMRRKIERWTDMLLGPLVPRHDIREFVFEEQRAREFARDYFENIGLGNPQCVWQLLLAGLRSSFPGDDHPGEEPRSWPEDLCRAVLRCLPSDAFHADGPFRGMLAVRAVRSGLRPERAPSRAISAAFSRPLSKILSPVQPSLAGIDFAKLRRQQRPGN